MIACASIALFGSGLFAKPFEDEYAYITQSYYTDLLLDGQFNHPNWLALPAYDLPPLPKYLIGASLKLFGLTMPGTDDARGWYASYRPFGPPEVLTAARIPMVAMGALGCVAIFGCGTLIKNQRVGMIAAALLMLNPLYRLHAHRAMSDVPCESFMLVALWLDLSALERVWSGRTGPGWWRFPVCAGLAAGLALLCKFNALLAVIIVGAWAVSAMLSCGPSLAGKLRIGVGTAATIVIAIALFIGLNPFMTARPKKALPPEFQAVADLDLGQRFRKLVDHRLEMSSGQQKSFPHNALFSLAEKSKVFAVQGFGRFGPLGPAGSDSTVRYDVHQDWGLLAWAPLVLVGLCQSVRLGRAQRLAGAAPTATSLSIWAVLTWLIVTTYLPMAWDRYLMPLQSVNSLLAALALSTIFDRLAALFATAGTRT